jgi:hypothetical protein
MTLPLGTGDDSRHDRETGLARRRPAQAMVILPPIAVPLTAERRERAAAVFSELICAWWDAHGRDMETADH